MPMSVHAVKPNAGSDSVREQAGLSLTDVADRSGIDKAALSRLENGLYSNPTINTLARYAKAIGTRFVPVLED
jgi:transcriptional regulator with XRE-family HTH domain